MKVHLICQHTANASPDSSFSGKSAGLLIHNGGNGLLDSNEIFKNALTGIQLNAMNSMPIHQLNLNC